jgi:hypothetical protein
MMEKLLEPRSEHWDEVVVVGYGFAGAAAAIEAHGRGAKILLIEKNATPGGISICSAGGVRIAKDRDAAFTYLKETNAGTTPDGPLAALADGMTTIARFVEDIAEKAGARPVINWMAGTYPLSTIRVWTFTSDIRTCAVCAVARVFSRLSNTMSQSVVFPSSLPPLLSGSLHRPMVRLRAS